MIGIKGQVDHARSRLGALVLSFRGQNRVIVSRRSQRLVVMEPQASPIDSETVLTRRSAHRVVGIISTIWIVVRLRHLMLDEDCINTRWVIELLKAYMDTPPSAKGESGYGCFGGFIDMASSKARNHPPRSGSSGAGQPSRPAQNRLPHEFHFGNCFVLVCCWRSSPTEVPKELSYSVKVLDSVPTRRVKGPANEDRKWKVAS